MNKKSKVLVTGGAGFIGNAVIEELAIHQYEIYVIDNLSFGNRRNLNRIGVDHFFQIDLLDRAALHHAIDTIDPEFVLHFAAIHFIPYCNEHPVLTSQINIQGSINVLDACKKLKNIEQVFFASTAAVYPIANQPLEEEMVPSPSDIYGLTKLAGERIFSEFHLQTGVPTIVGRFFNAFGPKETNPHIIPVIHQQIVEGKRTLSLGNLVPKRDYIHSTDIARAVVMLMQTFKSGFEVYNMGSGREYSVLEIVNAFEEGISEKLSVIQDPDRIRPSDRLHLLANIGKIKTIIKWSPEIHLKAGIRMLVKNDILV